MSNPYKGIADHICEEISRLNSRIAELERRNVMMTNVLKYVKRDCITSSDSFLTQGSLNRIDTALSSTSADTESWLQAEIVKRLGEPVAWQDATDGEFTTIEPYYPAAYYALYRLPSPLATPEERIKEGRI